MEYVFGVTVLNGTTVESLKTVDRRHSNLTGTQSVVSEYPDCVITDNFTVREKYRSSEDSEGNCYDWYVIDFHNQYIDKFTPEKEGIESGINDSHDSTCQISIDFDTRISELEDIICSMTLPEGSV